jgi:AraC-like DNA-binding protein
VDPLSSVLSLIKIQHAWSGKFEWGRSWCLSFGAYSGIHSYAVLKGECWLSVEGVTDAVHGKTGDSLLLPSGRPFRVGSDLNLPSLDINAIWAGTADQSLLQSYAGSDFAGIGGQFTLEETSGTLLTGVLPPILHIHDEKAKSLLRWTLEQLAEELEHDAPGGSLLIQQLSTVLLIQTLRVHLVMGVGQEPGWLSALADRQIRVALSAMHNNPEKKWTLDTLARTAGMSRTGFAIRFKQLVSRSPLDYLAHWRMLVAMEKLRNSKDSLATIAAVIGYDSQSSFSTAFRRIMNISPAQYGKQHGVKR